MSKTPSARRRGDISKARLLAETPIPGLGWRVWWLGGALGSGPGENPRGILNAFSMAQPASQVGRKGSQWGSIQQEGNFGLAQHLSKAVQEPGHGEGRMELPRALLVHLVCSLPPWS